MLTLPTAQKVVASKPPKNSVVAPTIKSEQEADVDRKMRVYGVIQAFRNGRMPDNTQIDETLRYVRDHSPIDTEQLSADGKQLIHDVRSVIETARRFVEEKNADEVVQQFFYHTSGAQLKETKPSIDAPISEKEAKRDGKEALQHLRTLFKLLITNSETRKLFSDAKLIGRDIFADAASNVADRSRPAQEELEQADEAAPSNEFENNKQGSVTSESFVSPPVFTQTQQQEHANELPSIPEDVDETATPSDRDSKASSAKKTMKARFQAIAGRVPEQHKQSANAELENGKKYLQKQFPKDRRDQVIYRLKKVVVGCQADPSYQASLSWFLSQLETYFSRGKRVVSTSVGQSSSSFFDDPILNQAMSEMRTLLERCANGQSMEAMLNAAKKMWEDAQNDEELRAWWGRVNLFVRKSLFEPGYILEPGFEAQARRLQKESRKFFDVKYKSHRDTLVDSIQSWFRAWTEDLLNKRLGDDISKLFKDLLFDSEDKLTYKPHLWTDIRQIILPTLMEKVGYVPIPRVEYTDKDLDLVIENLTLQGRNLFPKIFELNAQNYVKVSPYKEIRDEHHHELTVTLSQIQADMRDVAFYFRTKSGLRMSDSGLADVFLGGKGITVKIQLSSNTKERENGSLFKVKHVKVSVDALKFAIRDVQYGNTGTDCETTNKATLAVKAKQRARRVPRASLQSKHDFLYRVISMLATGLIKKAISKAISDVIRSGLEAADEKLVDFRDRMAVADDSEDGSKTKALKDLWNKPKSDTPSSKKSNNRESQFRIIPNRDSMLLPEQGHETGWIRKQFERDAAAAEGTDWKSKAFSLIPSAT